MAKGRKKLQICNFTSNDLDALLGMARCGIASKKQLQEYAYAGITEKSSERRLRAMVKEGLVIIKDQQVKKVGMAKIYNLTGKGKQVLISKDLANSFRTSKCNQLYHDMKLTDIYFGKTTRDIRFNAVFKLENELIKAFNSVREKRVDDMIDLAFKDSGKWIGLEAIGAGYTSGMIQSKINIGKSFDHFYYA